MCVFYRLPEITRIHPHFVSTEKKNELREGCKGVKTKVRLNNKQASLNVTQNYSQVNCSLMLLLHVHITQNVSSSSETLVIQLASSLLNIFPP